MELMLVTLYFKNKCTYNCFLAPEQAKEISLDICNNKHEAIVVKEFNRKGNAIGVLTIKTEELALLQTFFIIQAPEEDKCPNCGMSREEIESELFYQNAYEEWKENGYGAREEE